MIIKHKKRIVINLTRGSIKISTLLVQLKLKMTNSNFYHFRHSKFIISKIKIKKKQNKNWKKKKNFEVDVNEWRTCNWRRREAQVVREGEKEGGVEAIDAEERVRNETLEREKLGIEKTKTESVWSVVEIDCNCNNNDERKKIPWFEFFFQNWELVLLPSLVFCFWILAPNSHFNK